MKLDETSLNKGMLYLAISSVCFQAYKRKLAMAHQKSRGERALTSELTQKELASPLTDKSRTTVPLHLLKEYLLE